MYSLKISMLVIWGQKLAKFCGRLLWMAPNVMQFTHFIFNKMRESETEIELHFPFTQSQSQDFPKSGQIDPWPFLDVITSILNI